jgi:ATP-dependent Lon protease
MKMYNNIFISSILTNMYVGFWKSGQFYNRGEIVYVYELKEYFICILEHVSDDVTLPSKDDLYWVYVSSAFLSQIGNVNYSGMVSSKRKPTRQKLKIKTSDIKNNAQSDDEPNAPTTSNLKMSDFDLDDNLQNRGTSTNKIENTESKHNKKINKSYSDQEDYIENVKRNDLKRKLRIIEQDLDDHKKKKCKQEDEITNLRDKLLLMNIDLEMKSFIMDKYDSTRKLSGSDYAKGMNWLKTVSNIPYGKYKNMPVTKNDSIEKIKTFFTNVKQKLDKNIYGLEDVKQEILEFVAKKITNPDSKGHVLALYGSAGLGKTKIIRSLADALELPFYQMNFGGLNDVAILTGHSETYVGSKPGKVVEILTTSDYMNPIIYMDEIDKIGENKATEIFGVLTHLLDEEQNSAFQDNYLSNVNIDLSKVFFILSFNDITKVDEIVSDRLKVIYINPPTLEEKVIICQDKMIPEILLNVSIRDYSAVILDKEIIEYIISSKTQKENGVRQLRKNIEKIINRLNYDILVENLDKLFIETNNENEKTIVITRSYINDVLKHKEDASYLSMYV